MMEPWEIKELVTKLTSDYAGAFFDNKGMKGSIIGLLDKVCGSTGRRHVFLKYLFGTDSSKNLLGSQWIALVRWVDMVLIGDEWIAHNGFNDEVIAIIDAGLGSYFAKQPGFALNINKELLGVDVPGEISHGSIETLDQEDPEQEDPEVDYYEFD